MHTYISYAAAALPIACRRLCGVSPVPYATLMLRRVSPGIAAPYTGLILNFVMAQDCLEYQ
jgi:hypothetical protein